MLIRTIFIALLLAGVWSCSRTPVFVNYAELSDTARQNRHVPLPTILIPGIKGTVLRDRGGHKIWGYSGHVAFLEGFRRFAFSYPKITDAPTVFADYYREQGIYPQELLWKWYVGWKGLSFHDALIYSELRALLVTDRVFSLLPDRDNMPATAAASLFLLPYDWRLDNRVAAVRLALALPLFRAQHENYLRERYCQDAKRRRCTPAEISSEAQKEEFDEYLRRLQQTNPELFTRRANTKPELRFNVIAHSMGGLIAQYHIAQLGGWRDVANLITLGTPSKGAMDALKAFVDGEYPDTLWSTLFGWLPYPRRATTYIAISFPSMFQLLPRYSDAFTGLPMEKLGLAGPPSLLNDAALDEIFATYRKYRLTPEVEWLAREIPAEPAQIESIVRNHFRRQLLSAACFHSALDALGPLEAESETICREQARVREAAEFLNAAYPNQDDRFAPPGLAHYKERLVGLADDREMKTPFERRIVFGGHCQDTVSHAVFASSVTFRGTRQTPPRGFADEPGSVGTDRDASEKLLYGDSRVPYASAQFRRPNERWSSSFFVCADHVGLVRDESLKYNLLRLLLIPGIPLPSHATRR